MVSAPFARMIAALGILLTLSLLFLAAPAQAQAGVAGEPLQVCVLRDTGAMRAAELIRHPERFDCTSAQHRLGAGDYWAISNDIGVQGHAPLNVRVASLWQEALTLHVLYADGSMATSHADGHQTTRLIQLGAQIELRVSDTGIGVPKSERPHLFTKFYRAANARTARPDGTGLGLAISYRIIQKHSGVIQIENNPAHGITVVIKLPLLHTLDNH